MGGKFILILVALCLSTVVNGFSSIQRNIHLKPCKGVSRISHPQLLPKVSSTGQSPQCCLRSVFLSLCFFHFLIIKEYLDVNKACDRVLFTTLDPLLTCPTSDGSNLAMSSKPCLIH